MARTAKTPPKASQKRFTLSREAFAKINAVDGVPLNAQMIADFAAFDRKDLPASESRKAIACRYGKAHIWLRKESSLAPVDFEWHQKMRTQNV